MSSSHNHSVKHYLDNAATTWPKFESVYSTLDESFRNMFSPKRGSSEAAKSGAEKMLDVKKKLAKLFNINDPTRLVFTSGATHALNLAIQAFPWQSGDQVIMSAVEHHALSRPIRKMAREKGIDFFVVPYTNEQPFDLAHFENLLKTLPKVKLVATTHASNVIGCLLPIEKIGALCKQYNVPYLVDAAQTAGVLPIDVQKMNIDMMALPGHKCLYGPPGIGVLYIGEGMQDKNRQLNTFMEGGTGNDSGKHEMKPVPPDGFEVGTLPLMLMLTLGAALDEINQIGLSTIHDKEHALLKQLMNGLLSMPEVTVYGPKDLNLKTAVVSFNVKGISPKALGDKLANDYGIALRAGFHCAPMAHEAIGSITEGGTVRASIAYFTEAKDVDALLSALKQVIQTNIPASVASA